MWFWASKGTNGSNLAYLLAGMDDVIRVRKGTLKRKHVEWGVRKTRQAGTAGVGCN